MSELKEQKNKLPFDKQLILNQYVISYFGFKDMQDISSYINEDYKYDRIDAENHTLYATELMNFINNDEVKEKVKEYDYNIVSHLSHINKNRTTKIRLKYYQYLYLLFVEYYLDMYFNKKQELLDNINNFLNSFYNDDFVFPINDYMYSIDDLNTIALWSATGSGKTILMHINFLQFKHYSKNKYRKDVAYILITPNEQLSDQHIEELEKSDIEAENFNKIKGLNSDYISVMEITKLDEKDGEKKVAVDYFGEDNIVFVDEGHRGAKGNTWVENR